MIQAIRFPVVVMILGIIFLSTEGILCHYLALGLNASGSLPQKLFLIVKNKRQAIQVGDYVAFYPSSNPLYSSHTLFIKQVVGQAGDCVTEEQRVFYVNGKRIGYARPISSKGLVLKKGPVGKIPHDHYFVYAPHPRSFDSRYGEMGWIRSKNIIGRAYPLF